MSASSANYCCAQMFYGCTELRRPPKLPSTSLGEHAYSAMFHGCIKLEQVPALPATTVGANSYDYMFKDCLSLPVYTSSGEGHTQEFTIPTTGTLTSKITTIDMFKNTLGDKSAGGTIEFSLNTSYTKLPPVKR